MKVNSQCESERDIGRKASGGSDKIVAKAQAEAPEPPANLTFGQLTFGGQGRLQSSLRESESIHQNF